MRLGYLFDKFRLADFFIPKIKHGRQRNTTRGRYLVISAGSQIGSAMVRVQLPLYLGGLGYSEDGFRLVLLHRLLELPNVALQSAMRSCVGGQNNKKVTIIELVEAGGRLEFFTSGCLKDSAGNQVIVRAANSMYNAPWFDWVRARLEGGVEFACVVLAILSVRMPPSGIGQDTAIDATISISPYQTFLFVQRYKWAVPYLSKERSGLERLHPSNNLPLVQLDDGEGLPYPPGGMQLVPLSSVTGGLWAVRDPEASDSSQRYWILTRWPGTR